MPLGWIDFSKTERNKVLSVLDLLMEKGTLDELGIAPIRDGFANLFFPGTSTVQTRAKYFFIVPYILKDLEYSTETNPNRMLNLLDQTERECGERFLEGEEDTSGIIGTRSLRQGRWVKRTPSDIYWAGLRSYGIFNGGNISLTEYIRVMCAMKNQKKTLSSLGNRNDKAEENESDDKDAGGLFHMQFWKIPTYTDDWMEDLDIKLASDEGAFLKEQIVTCHPDSMLAYILKNNRTEVLSCDSFQALKGLMHTFPEEIRSNYLLAMDFSDFIYVLRVIYNLIVSENKNISAVEEWKRLKPYLQQWADVDLERIFKLLYVHGNVFLCKFLRKSQELMTEHDLEGLITEIKRRERELKQSRAKTMHPGEFDNDVWYGGGELDYRFQRNARTIIKDIFESEGLYVKSE